MIEPAEHAFSLGDMTIGGSQLTIIAGPCLVEDEEATCEMAERLRDIMADFDVSYIFKASYDKANRTSIESARGPGWQNGLAILQAVKERTGLPVISDVHETLQVNSAAEVLDMLQIPAFLCRQTDLLIAAGETGLPVNIK
ncbi:MAG: 3-deoxy-8-phosphooctulonate synthase, partial [Armatimonadota bacterium]